MADRLFPVAGSKLYIGGPIPLKDPMTAADFAGQEWVEVDGWASAGELGDTQEFIEQSLINRSRMLAVKGLLSGGEMTNTFVPMPNDPGQLRFRQAIEDRCNNYAFRVDWGADCSPTGTVVVSVGEPAVVTWDAHGLTAGQPIVFTASEGGALPTGLTAGIAYYVVGTDLTTNSFSVSALPGGAPVATTAAGTGTIAATASPAGMTDMFAGLAAPGARSGGDATASHTRTWVIRVNSNIVEI